MKKLTKVTRRHDPEKIINVDDFSLDSRKSTKKKSKEELYEERLLNENHQEILFVENTFFHTNDVLSELRNVVRGFNETVVRETRSIEYAVTLKHSIPKIAADFHFQFKKFRVYAKDHGLLPDIMDEFEDKRVILLNKSITWKQATGRFSLQKTFFEETKMLSIPARMLLILYKAYSNTPNRDAHDRSVMGITGLSDTTASIRLGCSRNSIATYRKELESELFITTTLVNNRFRKTWLRRI